MYTENMEVGYPGPPSLSRLHIKGGGGRKYECGFPGPPSLSGLHIKGGGGGGGGGRLTQAMSPQYLDLSQLTETQISLTLECSLFRPYINQKFEMILKRSFKKNRYIL